MEAFSHQWKITPVGKNKRGGMFVIWMNYFTFTIFTFHFLFTLVSVFLLHFPSSQRNPSIKPFSFILSHFPSSMKANVIYFPSHTIPNSSLPSSYLTHTNPIATVSHLRSGVSMAIPSSIRHFNGYSLSDSAFQWRFLLRSSHDNVFSNSASQLFF
jgi:hypothetical protein